MTIEAPDEAWSRHTSKRLGYSMGYPDGWSVVEAEGQDRFVVRDTPYIHVAPQKIAPTATVAAFRDGLIKSYGTSLKADPESDVENAFGGQPGRLLTYHFTDANGKQLYLVDAITVRAGRGWEVFLLELAGSEAEDFPFFQNFLLTFEFIDEG